VRELKALERVTLEPRETRMLRFEMAAAVRRYWSAEDRAYMLDESDFDVWVGGASTAELRAEFAVPDGAD
jgi:beta-glucosidase